MKAGILFMYVANVTIMCKLRRNLHFAPICPQLHTRNLLSRKGHWDGRHRTVIVTYV